MVMLSSKAPARYSGPSISASTVMGTGTPVGGVGAIPSFGISGGLPGYGARPASQAISQVLGGAFSPTQAPQRAGYASTLASRAVSMPAMNLGAYGGGGAWGGGSMLPPAQPMGGGGGGGGGMGRQPGIMGGGASFRPYDMSKMVGAYNKAYAAAKAANERRYQEMLGITAKTTGQREIDIRADYTQREAGAMQQLARYGMAGTTIAPTLGMGYEREQSAALDRLADEMQATKLGIIERRQDPYPSLASLTALGQMGPTVRGLEKLQF